MSLFYNIFGQQRLRKYWTFTLIMMAVFSGVVTYATLTQWPPNESQIDQAIILLYVDLAFLCFFTFVILRHIVRIAMKRRQGLAGAKLHERIIRYFLALVIVPTVFVAIFSAVFFNIGIEGWFSDKVQSSLNNSRNIAQFYLQEHLENIESEISDMAEELSKHSSQLYIQPKTYVQVLQRYAVRYSFPEIAVFNQNGTIIKNAMAFFSDLDKIVPETVQFEDRYKPYVKVENDKVQAIVLLKGFETDVYLIARRMIDPTVTSYIAKTNDAVSEYQALEKNRRHVQLVFSLIFVVVAMVVMLCCIWLGIIFASRLAEPISELIFASEQVVAGELSTRVAVSRSNDELRILGETFNEMTGRIETQQEKLIETNEKLAERSRFTEAVLSGVSTGVIGLNDEGIIHLPNRRASALLGIDLEKNVGQKLTDLIPELKSMVRLARRRPNEILETQMDWMKTEDARKFLIRISVEKDQGMIKGFVVTFDDISELVAAQKKSAWADIARRIAHEIKNPLTPIQLSAERLKRKYGKQIQDDNQTFINCTDTIIRQVTDIGQMVDEFSAFARMPQAKLQKNNIAEICQQVLTLQENAHQDVKFEFNISKNDVIIMCDARLIRQVLINIFQNALQAMEEKEQKYGAFEKCIKFYLEEKSKEIIIEVCDNGIGLPKEIKNNLTEPYVTTKEKGTGLGLAIVQRIMEDHNGQITFADREESGVVVRIQLPR